MPSNKLIIIYIFLSVLVAKTALAANKPELLSQTCNPKINIEAKDDILLRSKLKLTLAPKKKVLKTDTDRIEARVIITNISKDKVCFEENQFKHFELSLYDKGGNLVCCPRTSYEPDYVGKEDYKPTAEKAVCLASQEDFSMEEFNLLELDGDKLKQGQKVQKKLAPGNYTVKLYSGLPSGCKESSRCYPKIGNDECYAEPVNTFQVKVVE